MEHSVLREGGKTTHITFSRITLPDMYTDICTHTDSLRHTLWILLKERNWLKRTQEAPQEWGLILPRLKGQESHCYSTKQSSYWSLGPRSPSSLAGWVPAHRCRLFYPRSLSPMQPSFNCIDLASSSCCELRRGTRWPGAQPAQHPLAALH